MLKGSTRKPVTGRLAEIGKFLKPVLRNFHKNTHETVLGLIHACYTSGTVGFQILSEHLDVGPTGPARCRRVERYANDFKANMVHLWDDWAAMLLDRHIGDEGEVYLAIDWTEEPPMMTLCVSLLVEGRALPLWAKSYRKGAAAVGTQADIEREAVEAVGRWKTDGYSLILLGDRGFGNVRMALACDEYNLLYIFRIKADARGTCDGQNGIIHSWNVSSTKALRFDNTHYREDGALMTSIVHSPSIPTDRHPHPEPWWLMTNLPGQPGIITDTYAHRWGIECSFDDMKNSLDYQDPRWERSESIDRIFFILAVVVELATSAGASERRKSATRKCRPKEQHQRCVKQRNGRMRIVSFFTRGLALLRGKQSLAQLINHQVNGRCLLFR